MKASIVDLRYHMNDVLKALARNETVTIIYHGEEKGVIIPKQTKSSNISVGDTAMFGMYADDTQTVDDIMKQLRGGRYNGI